MAITKTIAAAATFAIVTCIGCAPGPRRLSRSRSHLSRCRQLLKHRTTEVPILLVTVQSGGPTLLHLCSDLDRPT